jgi:hypothetical protein
MRQTWRVPLRVFSGEQTLPGGQHTLPQILFSGQPRVQKYPVFIPFVTEAHKLPLGQHLLPQTRSPGQHVPFTHIWPVWQHTLPHNGVGHGSHFTMDGSV